MGASKLDVYGNGRVVLDVVTNDAYAPDDADLRLVAKTMPFMTHGSSWMPNKRLTATLTSEVPLSSSILNHIKSQLNRKTNKAVTPHNEEELLG